jgi:hypothetical protein
MTRHSAVEPGRAATKSERILTQRSSAADCNPKDLTAQNAARQGPAGPQATQLKGLKRLKQLIEEKPREIFVAGCKQFELLQCSTEQRSRNQSGWVRGLQSYIVTWLHSYIVTLASHRFDG